MEMMRIRHGLIENDISLDKYKVQSCWTLKKNKRKQLGPVPKIIPLMP